MPQWEYTSEKVAPGESWYDVLRLMGLARWEAWHIEKDANGWREIYFKRHKLEGWPDINQQDTRK